MTPKLLVTLFIIYFFKKTKTRAATSDRHVGVQSNIIRGIQHSGSSKISVKSITFRSCVTMHNQSCSSIQSGELMSVVSVFLSALLALMGRDEKWLTEDFHATNVCIQKYYKYIQKWFKIHENCIAKLIFSLKRLFPVSFIMLLFHVSFIYSPSARCEG